MADRTLTVKIVGDSRSLERAFKQSDRQAQIFAGRMNSVNQATRGALSGFGSKSSLLFGSGAFVGTAAASAGFRAAINEASRLNEQISRTRVVFGESADAVLKWSQTSADAMGLVRSQALNAAASFAGILQTSGLTEKASARMSRRFVQLASDMASFSDEDPSEMLDRLRSGLAGEAEPLRRFQVLLSAARVEQEAYASGIANVGAKLTEGQKVQARYNIILQDTAKQHGNFTDTADEFANAQRRLRAQIQNLAGEVGTVALPALTDFVVILNEGSIASRGFATELRGLVNELPGDRDVDKTLILDALPGIGQLRQLKSGFEGINSILRGIQDTASEPFEFDFNSVKRLTQGLLTASAAAKDLIEARRAAEAAGNQGVNITAEQRNTFFDARLGRRFDRVQDIDTLRGQVAELKRIAGVIQQRIEITKDITRRLNLEDDLLDVQRQIQAAQNEIAQNIKAEQEEAKRLAQEAAALARDRAVAAAQHARDLASFAVERARATVSLTDDLNELRGQEGLLRGQLATDRGNLDLRRELLAVQTQITETIRQQREQADAARTATQFRALGLGPTGAELIPGAKALKAQLGNIADAVRGTFLDTGKTRSLLSQIRKVLSGGLGRVSEEVRAKVREMLADIDQQLKQSEERRTKFRPASVDSVLSGLGLSPDEIRALRPRIAQIGRGGTVPAAGVGAFGVAVPAGGGVTITGPVSIYPATGTADAIERELQKVRMRQSASRRGPHAGQQRGSG